MVFDVGANIGMASLFFHTECPAISVHAFEPGSRTFAALRENMAEFKVPVTLHNAAVSDAPGAALFDFYPHCTALSGLHPDPEEATRLTRIYFGNLGFSESDVEELLVDRFTRETEECRVTTVSEVISEWGIGAVGLLKVDVEKSELAVLRGVRAEHWPRIRQVVMEVHDLDGAGKAAVSLLEEQGFRVTVEQEPLLAGTEVYEVFAVRPGAAGGPGGPGEPGEPG